MSAMSALQLDDAPLRLQRVDTLRTQQNVTLMQIVEIGKRLEEQRLEMLSNAMPGDRNGPPRISASVRLQLAYSESRGKAES